ncbi:MAG: hypothetical protein DRJ10_19020 [Bacteroidetes bacterium]|nr:MAG: hypothetical protein DRJ10_19020 [Bacteroidota bacterium]
MFIFDNIKKNKTSKVHTLTLVKDFLPNLCLLIKLTSWVNFLNNSTSLARFFRGLTYYHNNLYFNYLQHKDNKTIAEKQTYYIKYQIITA